MIENFLLLLKELLMAAVLPHYTAMRWEQLIRIGIIIRQAAAAGMSMKKQIQRAMESPHGLAPEYLSSKIRIPFIQY